MLIIQFGLWFNAREIALAAAQAGARVAREEGGGQQSLATCQTDASSTAENYYRGLNTHLLGDLTATANCGTADGGQTAGITVSGPLGYSVFSWFGSTWTVSVTVTGPVECFHLAAVDGACQANGAGG